MQTTPAPSFPPEFFLVHRGLPREGPGNDAATLQALRRLPPLPASPRVLDLGCGPGAQTETEREIAGFELQGSTFGYQFFLMQRQG